MKKIITVIAVATYFVVGLVDLAAFFGMVGGLFGANWTLFWKSFLVGVVCSAAGFAIIGTTMGLVTWLEKD